jgi:hypothetical protein
VPALAAAAALAAGAAAAVVVALLQGSALLSPLSAGSTRPANVLVMRLLHLSRQRCSTTVEATLASVPTCAVHTKLLLCDMQGSQHTATRGSSDCARSEAQQAT